MYEIKALIFVILHYSFSHNFLKKLPFIFLIFCQSLFGQHNAVISNLTFGKEANIYSIYDDTSFNLGIEQIKNLYTKGRFKAIKGNTLSRGNSKANHWLHFKAPKLLDKNLVLELDNPRLNLIYFYELSGESLVNQIITGDSQPFASRGIIHNKWVFPLKNLGENTDIFIMINKQFEALSVNFNLQESHQFAENSNKKYLFWGILAGLTALVLLVNIFIWLATKDPIYGWFLLVIFTAFFHILCASGLGFQYIWPQFPAFNSWYPQTFSVWLGFLFQLLFMQKFIGQNAQNSRIYKFVKYFEYLILFSFILFVTFYILGLFAQPYFQWLLIITLIFNLLIIPLALCSVLESRKKQESLSKFFALVIGFKALNLFVYLGNYFLKVFNYNSLDTAIVDYLFVLIVLAIGVVYFGFRKYQQQNEQLLTSLHISEQAQNKKIIDALEIERNRIAEDLYDDVGAMLSTAINYQSSVLRKDDNTSKFPILVESRKLLDRAVENLRTVSHNLMPKNFAELGLSKSLEETLNKVAQNSEIEFDYKLVGHELRLEPAKEVQIFRIAAELINDIIRNSQATKATIQLVYGPENLTLMAEDDGPGEPVHNNLTSKVDFIGGQLHLDYSPSGLTAVVEIPYGPSPPDGGVK